MINIKVKKVHPNARIPRVATEGSACFDLHCCERFVVYGDVMTRVRIGYILEIPKGYCIEVLSRSGVASRGIIIPNAPGIIDSDYRGEVFVMLYGAFVSKPEIFEVGSRVAQARLVKLEQTMFEEVSDVTNTIRGAGALGSTGK